MLLSQRFQEQVSQVCLRRLDYRQKASSDGQRGKLLVVAWNYNNLPDGDILMDSIKSCKVYSRLARTEPDHQHLGMMFAGVLPLDGTWWPSVSVVSAKYTGGELELFNLEPNESVNMFVTKIGAANISSQRLKLHHCDTRESESYAQES